jgi:hypothetical protein
MALYGSGYCSTKMSIAPGFLITIMYAQKSLVLLNLEPIFMSRTLFRDRDKSCKQDEKAVVANILS